MKSKSLCHNSSPSLSPPAATALPSTLYQPPAPPPAPPQLHPLQGLEGVDGADIPSLQEGCACDKG